MSTATTLAPVPALKLPASAAAGRSGIARRAARTVRGAGTLVVADTLAMFAAIAATFAVVTPDPLPTSVDAFLAVPVTVRNLLGVLISVGVWPLCFKVWRVYRLDATTSSLIESLRLAGAVAVCVLLLPAGAAVAGMPLPGPVVLWHAWWVSAAALVASRAIQRAVSRWRRRQQRQRVLIVGAGPRAAAVEEQLLASEEAYEIVGFVDDDPAVVAPPRIAGRIIGRVATLDTMLMRHAIDEVFVALPVKSQYGQIQDALRACEQVGVRARYRTDLCDAELAWPTYEPEEGHVVMQVAPDGYGLVIKRAIDIVASAVLLVGVSPIMLAAAAAVKLTSEGPVLFGQDRYGRNRRRFRMLKFRTMVADAEQLQKQLEDRNEADGPVFKITDDPRITPVGRFLRRTSIDELPQLLNVLRGDMSLVGPRPLPLRDVERFTRAGDMRRCSVRPGITCLWQVSGRNNLSFDQWMQLDLRYIDAWSLVLDFEILLRTIPAVLRRTGAR
jgi:exopolysaccharide biosynthesis polyprenyl glycosylphosphotransferase